MRLRHVLLRLALTTVGRLSEGVRLGYREGFDSGTMVDYVYRDEARGISPLGRLIDRAMLGHPVWQGVRDRRRLLIRQLTDELADRPTGTLFDVAAGPGSYLFELGAAEGRVLWAGDIDPDEAAHGRARAAAEGRTDIRFVVADAFDPSSWPAPQVDILVASGFFDILVDDGDVARLLAAGTAVSGPGARWVFTVMEHHPDLELLRDVLVDFHGRPWVARTRRAEEILAHAEPLGWRAVSVVREPRGFFAVAVMERG